MTESPSCFQVHVSDNVATALDQISPGQARVVGPDGASSLLVLDDVSAGHKIALTTIETGGPIVKFGVPIGRATQAIEPGRWVHLHNCASNHDERSQTLDPRTGATTDTAYE